jgi:hypothetical protein
MKLDLLTNATAVDDAIRFVSSKSKEKLKSSSEDDKEESREPDYDEDGDRLEEEETGEMARYDKSRVLNLIRSSIVFD